MDVVILGFLVSGRSGIAARIIEINERLRGAAYPEISRSAESYRRRFAAAPAARKNYFLRSGNRSLPISFSSPPPCRLIIAPPWYFSLTPVQSEPYTFNSWEIVICTIIIIIIFFVSRIIVSFRISWWPREKRISRKPYTLDDKSSYVKPGYVHS